MDDHDLLLEIRRFTRTPLIVFNAAIQEGEAFTVMENDRRVIILHEQHRPVVTEAIRAGMFRAEIHR